MLALKRLAGDGKRRNELRLTLPDGRAVRVVIINARGNKVTVGVEAPADVEVMRGELVEQDPSR